MNHDHTLLTSINDGCSEYYYRFVACTTVGGRDVMKDPARTNQLIRLNTIDEAILSICSVESGEGACQMKDEVLK